MAPRSWRGTPPIWSARMTEILIDVDDIDSSNLTDLSVSRVGVANKCGLAFKYQYVDRLPRPYDSGAIIFGNVIHDAVAEWYGTDADKDKEQHRKQDLRSIVHSQWIAKLPEPLFQRLDKC